MGDFTIQASPGSQAITQGATTTFSVTVQSVNGFNSPVNLFALNLPGNQVLPGTVWSPTSVTPSANGSATATLTIVTNSTTPTGTFTVTLEGRSGSVIRNTTVTLTVTGGATPDFTIQASPGSRTVTQGATTTFSVTVQSVNGFNSAVNLFALNLPGNQVLPGTGWSPTSVTPSANGSATATLTIVTNSTTPIGTSTITIEGRGPTITRSTTVSLTVAGSASADFSIQSSPTARSVRRGASASYTISVQGTGGFANSVGLFAINLPGNQVLPGTGFSPQNVNPGGASTLTINTDGATQLGTFPITVEGRSGGVTRTAQITLDVQAAAGLSIGGINPSTITKNTTVTFTLTGTSFQSGFTATLINEAGSRFDIPSKQFVDSNTVRVTAFIGNGPTSTQRIEIRNPDGQVASIAFTALANPPVLRIDGGTSSSRQIGQTFTFTGSGYAIGRTTTRHLRNPDGSQIVLNPTLTADGSGNIGWIFAPLCGNALGTFTIWVVDDATGLQSNSVTETVLANPTCR